MLPVKLSNLKYKFRKSKEKFLRGTTSRRNFCFDVLNLYFKFGHLTQEHPVYCCILLKQNYKKIYIF